jgi:hypothetical protein
MNTPPCGVKLETPIMVSFFDQKVYQLYVRKNGEKSILLVRVCVDKSGKRGNNETEKNNRQ